MISDSTSILLVGHGTKSVEGISQFNQVVEKVSMIRPEVTAFGFIELARPSIAEAVDNLISSQRPKRVLVVPVLLLAAGHMKLDIPEAIVEVRTKYPDVEFVFAKDLSISSQLLDIEDELGRSPFTRLGSAPIASETRSTLLVGRGSTDPDANSDLYKIARLLSERKRLGLVEPAFISLTEPSVPQGLERLRLLGAKRITVLPYFLFKGALLERIYRQCETWHRDTGVTAVEFSAEIGTDSRLVELISQRIDEAASPKMKLMNCDTCIRHPSIHPRAHHNHN